jgi:hypothetical protein
MFPPERKRTHDAQLLKAIYGMKQLLELWDEELSNHIVSLRYEKKIGDKVIYQK